MFKEKNKRSHLNTWEKNRQKRLLGDYTSTQIGKKTCVFCITMCFLHCKQNSIQSVGREKKTECITAGRNKLSEKGKRTRIPISSPILIHRRKKQSEQTGTTCPRPHRRIHWFIVVQSDHFYSTLTLLYIPSARLALMNNTDICCFTIHPSPRNCCWPIHGDKASLFCSREEKLATNQAFSRQYKVYFRVHCLWPSDQTR